MISCMTPFPLVQHACNKNYSPQGNFVLYLKIGTCQKVRAIYFETSDYYKLGIFLKQGQDWE